MSNSLEDEEGKGGEHYGASHRNLNLMMRTGRSFSGRERNRLFLNRAGKGFSEVAALAGLDFKDDARAVARGDYDGDGDDDLWITNRTGPVLRILQNTQAKTARTVSFLLRGNGVTTNRDAIGARVELSHAAEHGDTTSRSIRTVRAGDGFLAQSSGVVNFAFERSDAETTVEVHWPGGEIEKFGTVGAGGRYLLEQGSGIATAQPKPPMEPANEPSPERPLREGRAEPLTEPTAAPRTAPRTALLGEALGKKLDQAEERTLGSPPIAHLAFSVPLPRFPYQALDGSRATLESSEGRPLWILLWASWCPPCLEELAEVTKNADRLREAGIDVHALSVEGLGDGGPDRDTPAQDAAEGDADPMTSTMGRLGFPFAAGWANGPMMGLLQSVHDVQMTLDRALPVPAGVLVDAGGNITHFVRGRVALDTILATLVPQVSAGASVELLPGAVAGLTGRRLPIAPVERTRKQRVTSAQVATAARMESARFPDAAAALYRDVIESDPANAPALTGLAGLLAAAQQFAEAEELFVQATKQTPFDPGLWNNLGSVRASRGNFSGASKSYQRALELRPDFPEAQANLARVRALRKTR